MRKVEDSLDILRAGNKTRLPGMKLLLRGLVQARLEEDFEPSGGKSPGCWSKSMMPLHIKPFPT